MKNFPIREVCVLACMFMMMGGFGTLIANAENEYSNAYAFGAFLIGVSVLGLGIAWITSPGVFDAPSSNPNQTDGPQRSAD